MEKHIQDIIQTLNNSYLNKANGTHNTPLKEQDLRGWSREHNLIQAIEISTLKKMHASIGSQIEINTTPELILLPHCLRVTGALSPYHPLTMNSLAINQQINNPQVPNQHKQSSKAKIIAP